MNNNLKSAIKKVKHFHKRIYIAYVTQPEAIELIKAGMRSPYGDHKAVVAQLEEEISKGEIHSRWYSFTPNDEMIKLMGRSSIG